MGEGVHMCNNDNERRGLEFESMVQGEMQVEIMYIQ